MAINLLTLAKFVDGERPSAAKFNKLFSFIENRLNALDETIGSGVDTGTTTVVDSENNIFQVNLNHYWGFKKFLLEKVNNGLERKPDIVSLTKSIGSMSNLNPLMLGGEKEIFESIPVGVNEYEFKYPLLVSERISPVTTWPEWLIEEQQKFDDEPLLSDGDWKLYNSFMATQSDNVEYEYAKSIVFFSTSTETFNFKYKTNPEHWGSGASYQGSTFNVIPDFNTPKIIANNGNYFYNLNFVNNGATYTTVTLPYILYQQVSLTSNDLDTSLLNSNDINHHKQLTLPKVLKDYQLTLDPPDSEFPIPKGFMYLVDFSSDTFTILDDLDYIYVDENTFKVNLSSSILECVTASPLASNYKQLFLVTNSGTDITRSINDLQIKLNKHNHDGSFGEPLVHISNVAGLYEKTNRNVYFPSSVNGHNIPPYLHRDGHVYNSDIQNYDNAMMGDLLMYGEGSESTRSSYKIFFSDHQTTLSGMNIIAGYMNNSNWYSWIGLYLNTLNIQGPKTGNLSLLSDNQSIMVAKEKQLIAVKEINYSDSINISNDSFIENRVEDLKETTYLYQDNVKQELHAVSLNKITSYSNDEDHSSKIELNHSSDVLNTISLEANKGLVTINTQDLEINYKNYDYQSEEIVKNSAPIISLNISGEPSSLLNEEQQLNSTLTLNNTNTEKGIYVYTVHHLINEPSGYEGQQYSFDPIDLVVPISGGSATYYQSWDQRCTLGFNTRFNIDGNSIKINDNIIGNLSRGSYDYYFNKALINNKSLFDSTLKNGILNNFYNDQNFNQSDASHIYFDQKLGRLILPDLISSPNAVKEGRFSMYYQNTNSDNNNGRYRTKWIWNNPYPTSMEYLFQYISYFGFMALNSPTWNHYIFSPAFKTQSGIEKSPYEPGVLGFDNISFLIKMVWRKWYIKGANSDSLDISKLYNQILEMETGGSLNYSKENITLIESGFVIDQSLDKVLKQEIKDSVEEDMGDLSNIYYTLNRKCRFYKKKTTKRENDKLANSGVEKPVLTPVEEGFTDYDFNLDNASGTILFSLSNIGTIDPFDISFGDVTFNKQSKFFDLWEEHFFEEDENLIILGKGFMNFNLNGDHYTSDGDEYLSGSVGRHLFQGQYIPEDDVVYNRDIKNDLNDIDNIASRINYARDLKIKLKSNNKNSSLTSKKQKISLIYSDFFVSRPESTHNCFSLDGACSFLEEHSYYEQHKYLLVDDEVSVLYENYDENNYNYKQMNNKYSFLNDINQSLGISLYKNYFNNNNWKKFSLNIFSGEAFQWFSSDDKPNYFKNVMKSHYLYNTSFYNDSLYNNNILLKKTDYNLDKGYSRSFVKEPNTFFSSLTIEYAENTEKNISIVESAYEYSANKNRLEIINSGNGYATNKNRLTVILKAFFYQDQNLLRRRFTGPTQPIFNIEIESKKTSINSFSTLPTIGQVYNISVNTEIENCALVND